MWNPLSGLRTRRNGSYNGNYNGGRNGRRNGNYNGNLNGGPAELAMPELRLGTLEDVAGAGTAPIMSVSVGTTGLNRARLYYRRMRALGCDHRIQSMLIYDCNQVNINNLHDEAARNGYSDKMALPEYLPFSEGFLRRVDQYERHYGAIERDMERMVDDAEHKSLRAGTEPQVILEWIGFGGHAMLSYMFHDIVVKRFPEARILPIVCFPDDRGMQQNIRKYNIWPEAEKMLGPVATLLTDNRRGSDYRRLDEALTIALAAVECCFKYDPSFGSLAEVVSVFNIVGNRWIAIEHTEIPLINRNALGQNGSRPPEDARRKAIGKQAQKIKSRICEIAQPQNPHDKSAFFTPGTRESEQRIYVTMPVEPGEVDEIRDDIEDQLKREEFSKAFPGTQIAYAAGNPQEEPNAANHEYIHIVKFVGLPSDHPQPLSLTSILDNIPLPDDVLQRRHGSVKTWGQKVIEADNAYIPSDDDTADADAAVDAAAVNADTPAPAAENALPGNGVHTLVRTP